ncbi:MAG: hypothetical protein K9J37_21510 [Saprospiraceae bacterium]|nr:hypothetical protein [Saprospiraceae bacterium]MCF8252500.1 hypothetical protein [Saprospiraceae bacterium]MCF8282524.1 hypothetical protein [Bacteroidales bacterium]MCF8314111.1 hypothetical protein [Saprospiraceae bacterium]MCF8442854.1 hypothetical protein [Saprospiraceae bacterium]
MAKRKIDDSTIFIRCDQPTQCPHCGARIEVLLDFSHTIRQVQLNKYLDEKLVLEVVEETDEANLFPKIKLSYLYRDADNYKLFHSIVIDNPENVPIEQIEATIRKHLISGECFNPKEWGLPKPRFEVHDEEADHDWCEFECLELTHEIADHDVSISELLDIIEGKTSIQSSNPFL